MNLVTLEWRKMRRLRVGWLLALMVVIVLGVVLGGPDSEGPTTLLSHGMIAALVGPLFMAVLASRQTDIEHTGGGWVFLGTAGVRAARVCRAKILALAPLVAAAVIVQVAVVGQLNGQWAFHAVGLIVTNLALLTGHVLLSARVDNQLVTIGIGALGSFVAVVSLLFPPWVSYLHPWGYYALSLPTAVTESGVAYEPVRWLPVTVLALIVAAVVLPKEKSHAHPRS